MNEIEVKVLNINKEEIEKKLLEIGAKLIKEEEQINIRFDTEDRYLRNIYHGYLRIRITKDNLTGETTNTLTIKRNIARDVVRVNEEIETEISNVDETIRILDALKYYKKKPGKKHRKSYIYENILFEIDEWDKEIYPHPYLEIEVTGKNDLEKAIKLLNIDKQNITAKSIDELVKGK